MVELPLSLRRWLIGVGNKLNDEGHQLLKLLYYYDLQYAKLADDVKAPKDLFEFSRGLNARSDEATLALFFHRLSLLIPRTQPDAEDPEEMMNIKNLGAQDSVNHLKVCELSPPSIQVDDISQESRLLECLVTVYVNMSQRKRRELRQQIAGLVGVNYENFGIFELFCKLLDKSHNMVQEILDELVNVLNKAPAPQPVVKNLIYQLDNYNIPHTLSAENINTLEESKEDYIKETSPTIIKEEVHIISRRRPICKCTKKRITCCFAVCIPFALVVLGIVVSTATLSTYNKSDESVREFEVSSRSRHCDEDAVNTGVPLIRLGSVNSFWYRDILIAQKEIDSKVYKDVAVQLFVVPSDLVIEQTKQFSCNLSYYAGVLLEFDQLYLLRGSILSFNVCIKSLKEDSPGFITLTIYDSNVDFKTYDGMFLHRQQFYVEANNGINCSTYHFTATHDSLYYVSDCDVDCNSTSNALITSYRIDADMRYVNYTDLANPASVCQLDVSTKECLIPIDKGNDWFFSAKTYDIFANVTSVSTKLGAVGHLKIQASFRSTVYIVPAIIGGILLVMIYSTSCGMGCLWCIYKVKGRRQEEHELEER